jgi:hypothetical protein
VLTAFFDEDEANHVWVAEQFLVDSGTLTICPANSHGTEYRLRATETKPEQRPARDARFRRLQSRVRARRD